MSRSVVAPPFHTIRTRWRVGSVRSCTSSISVRSKRLRSRASVVETFHTVCRSPLSVLCAAAALDAAWADFTACPSKYTYADLMQYVPKAERATWHRKAMETLDSPDAGRADLRSLIDLWFETKEVDRLVARLHRASDGDRRRAARKADVPPTREGTVVDATGELSPHMSR